MTAEIVALRDYARPHREPPSQPAEVVPLPKKPEPAREVYPMAILGSGWPPEDMLPPADV